jgi:hypothetical protein
LQYWSEIQANCEWQALVSLHHSQPIQVAGQIVSQGELTVAARSVHVDGACAGHERRLSAFARIASDKSLVFKQEIGSSGRTRTLKSTYKSNAISNLLKILSRTILRFRRVRLLRRKLVQKLVQTGTKEHGDFRVSRNATAAADDRHHSRGVGQD